MIELYARQFEIGGPDLPTGRKGRIFTKVCASSAPTRKKLAEQLGIRPATMSEITLELINDGLVLEARPGRNLHKGRPEIILRPNADRLVAIVCYLVSHTVHCALVNLAGETLYNSQFEALADQTDNEAFLSAISNLCAGCLDQVPNGSTLAGIALSLPGIVDEVTGFWRYSSHWPKLRNLDLSSLTERLDSTVTVSKNLKCELHARRSRGNHQTSESLLMLHWGFGIGAAFAHRGSTFAAESRGFGEVGHTCVDSTSTALCKCGMTGCVEAEAGIWAIAERMKGQDIPEDEWQFEQFLRDNPDLDIWERPVKLMALTLRNLCLTLSPDQCIITGPFAQSEPIFSRLVKCFEENLPTRSLVVGENRTKLRAGRAGTQDEIVGAASTVFQPAINLLCRD